MCSRSSNKTAVQWFHMAEASFMAVGVQPLYQWMIAPAGIKDERKPAKDLGMSRLVAVLQV